MSESEPIFTTHHQRWLQIPFYVPDRLPVQPAGTALRKTSLVIHFLGSARYAGRIFDLAEPYDRAEVYQHAIIDGEPAEILEYIDGPSLVEIWDTHMVMPRDIEAVWRPLIDAYREKNK